MARQRQTTRGPEPPQRSTGAIGGQSQQPPHQNCTVRCFADPADNDPSTEGNKMYATSTLGGSCKQQSWITYGLKPTTVSRPNILLLLVVMLCLIGRSASQPANCAMVGHSGGSDGNGGCLCQSHYNWTPSNSTCTLDCTSVVNSTGTAVSQVQCGCNAGTVWDVSVYKCVVTCSALMVYHPIYKACVPDCANLNYTTNISNWRAYPNALGYRCACLISFEWNYATGRCECLIGTVLNSGVVPPRCDCGTVTPPDPVTEVALTRNATSGKCSCPIGVVTDATFQTKILYKIDLGYCKCPNGTDIDSTFQVAIEWKSPENVCECPNLAITSETTQVLSHWNPTTKFCECPRASTCDDNYQALIEWNLDLSVCECPKTSATLNASQAGLEWNPNEEYCECPHTSEYVDLTTQAILVWDGGNRYCTCPIPQSAPDSSYQTLMVWDSIKKVCECPNAAAPCELDYQSLLVWNPTLAVCECPHTTT